MLFTKLIYTYLHADFEIGDSDLDSDDDSSHEDPPSNRDNEISNRMAAVGMKEDSKAFGSSIVKEIREALDTCDNRYVHTYNKIRDTLHSQNPPSIKLRILGKRGRDGRRYNLPTASEVAALIVGDFDGENPERDVIVETKVRASLLHMSDYIFLNLSSPMGNYMLHYPELPRRKIIMMSTARGIMNFVAQAADDYDITAKTDTLSNLTGQVIHLSIIFASLADLCIS
ncbi:DNA helicase [Trifolium repens]|nr:DNA helicase [Trifolium repens]